MNYDDIVRWSKIQLWPGYACALVPVLRLVKRVEGMEGGEKEEVGGGGVGGRAYGGNRKGASTISSTVWAPLLAMISDDTVSTEYDTLYVAGLGGSWNGLQINGLLCWMWKHKT